MKIDFFTEHIYSLSTHVSCPLAFQGHQITIVQHQYISLNLDFSVLNQYRVFCLE